VGHPGGGTGAGVTILLYARTLAGLRPRQLVHLLGARLRPRRHTPPAPLSAALDAEALGRFETGLRAAGPGDAAARIARAERLLSGRLSLLGVEVDLATLDWGGTPVSPLWTYHLHYLDWAVDLAWAFRLTGKSAYLNSLVELLDRWDAATRATAGRAWEPYPHAARALNLALLLALVGGDLGAERRARLVELVAGYAAVAERDLERHLEGNHLWRDVSAWIVAGHLLSGARWVERRQRALVWWERVRKEQLLADGGHEERSPLYHALALQDLALTLLALPEGEVRVRVHADGARMLPALQALLRPSGVLHHFNDSAARDDLDPPFLLALLRAVDLPVTAERGVFDLPETGYAGMIGGEGGDRLIVDHGLPAPRHQPGHLHCDLLSFEFDLRGRPLVVNGGVSGFEGDPLRGYFRGNAAHNTVQVGGFDQSELWGVFRVARMARAGEYESGADGAEGWRFRGTMSPYAPPGVVHRRTIVWRPGRLDVEDEISGGAGYPGRVFLLFAPDVALRRSGPLSFEAIQGNVRVEVTWEGVSTVQIHEGEHDPPRGWHAARFGEVRPAPCLVAEFAGARVSRIGCLIEETSFSA
jgi:hypothetical protein